MSTSRILDASTEFYYSTISTSLRLVVIDRTFKFNFNLLRAIYTHPNRPGQTRSWSQPGLKILEVLFPIIFDS